MEKKTDRRESWFKYSCNHLHAYSLRTVLGLYTGDTLLYHLDYSPTCTPFVLLRSCTFNSTECRQTCIHASATASFHLLPSWPLQPHLTLISRSITPLPLPPSPFIYHCCSRELHLCSWCHQWPAVRSIFIHQCVALCSPGPESLWVL